MRSKTMRFLLFILMILTPAADGWALICDVEAPPVLSITADENSSSFTLSFDNFTADSVSTTQSVVYRVEANKLAGGLLEGTVTANLAETFDDIQLEASMDAYQNLGESGFATLTKSHSGFTEIGTNAVALAQKETGQPCCDTCIDGNLTITWRAKITKDHVPVHQSRSLIITLRDGH